MINTAKQPSSKPIQKSSHILIYKSYSEEKETKVSILLKILSKTSESRNQFKKNVTRDLYHNSFKSLKNEVKDLSRWKILYALGLKESVLLK